MIAKQRLVRPLLPTYDCPWQRGLTVVVFLSATLLVILTIAAMVRLPATASANQPLPPSTWCGGAPLPLQWPWVGKSHHFVGPKAGENTDVTYIFRCPQGKLLVDIPGTGVEYPAQFSGGPNAGFIYGLDFGENSFSFEFDGDSVLQGIIGDRSTPQQKMTLRPLSKVRGQR